MSDIITIPFFHNGLWYWFRYNKGNAMNLLSQNRKSATLFNVVNFLDQIAFNYIVPSYLFRKKSAVRVTEMLTESVSLYEEKECRFKGIIEKEIKNEKLSRHSRILIPILEKDPNSLATEIPVWNEWFYDMNSNKQFPLVGHIDLLQFIGQKVYIWDYKPEFDINKDTGLVINQVELYKQLLLSLVDIKYEDITCGWFNNTKEYIILA